MSAGAFRLATRGSDLALAQTREVARLLREHGCAEVEEEIFRTAGDKNLEADLATAGALAKGLFTKELEEALLSGRADAAVHSLKDLPVELPRGLAIGAVLPRADIRDVLISPWPEGLRALPSGTKVGTGSPRRCAMLLRERSDVEAAPIRGNVPTRLAKLEAGGYGAIILAAAGLSRLGWPAEGGFAFGGNTFFAVPLESFLPAPGQGAVAVEVRAGDERAGELLLPLHDSGTDAAVRAERAVLAALGGGCHMALGARAQLNGGVLRLEAVMFDAADEAPKYAALAGRREDPESLGRAVAAELHGG